SALDGLLRIFDSAGKQLAANDNFDGRDPALTFQAPAGGGDFFLGVSSAGNATYDPHGTGAVAGRTTGRYTLALSRVNAPLQPDLVGALLSLAQDAAAPGDTLTVTYTVENRGGAGTGAGFNVGFHLQQDGGAATA